MNFIKGNQNPVVGNTFYYEVVDIGITMNFTKPEDLQYVWYIYKKRKNGNWENITKTEGKTGAKVPYKFGEIAVGIQYKLEVFKALKNKYTGKFEAKLFGKLEIVPTSSKNYSIQKVVLFNNGAKDPNKATYKDSLIARAYCVAMFNKEIQFKLWEDDAPGGGHNAAINKNNQLPQIFKARVNEKGIAEVKISLISNEKVLKAIANKYLMSGDKSEGSNHEYYVTASYDGKIQGASQVNVDVANPDSQPKKDSAIFSGNSNQPAKSDKEGKVTHAYFIDSKGNPTQKIKVGDNVRIRIKTVNMISESFQYIIWEKDILNSDDIFRSPQLKIIANAIDTAPITITQDKYNEGIDGDFTLSGDSDKDQQQYYIEIIPLNSKAKSISFGIDDELKRTKVENVKSAAVVKEIEKPKEKFEKIIGLGKEALLYISSEIATEIKVDTNDKITSYPDYGGFNGMNEYKEGGKLYCKKLPNGKSAFPLYKMYIYRAGKIGESLKKLKQDLENKTHENAESTILTVARHAQTNNKDYGKSGPLPPNTISSLYRIRYMQAWNHAKKESFRYRIVSDTTSNLKVVKDVSKEVSNGAMTLGNRGSISIDPWSSAGLIGCVGIRNSDGKTHSSCEKEYPNQDSTNYKFIYHALNNYLETIIPELTGVYGRRGYSSNGKVAVKASGFKEEVKVFVLVDPLPELNSCKLNLKKDGRVEFYNEFGTSAIKMVENKGKSNKFKGLYMVAQRRQENGFKLAVPNNNPMNIKGKGDLGSSALKTHEYENGKKVNITDGFANFSTVEKGFDGYLNLLQRNYLEAYNAILEDSKTIDDFLIGMQDKGRIGSYATDPNYKTLIKSIYDGVVKDYKEILNYKLCCEKTQDGKNKIKKEIELLNKLK